MTNTLIQEVVDEGIVKLVLNRAPVNALNPEFMVSIEQHLSAIAEDPGIRALIVTSGLPVFSAGMDLKEAQEFSVAEQTAVVDGLNVTFATLFGLPKPVIAAVNGAAIAGGMFFVLASDYAVARQGAKFGLTEVRVGVNFPIAPLTIARSTLDPGVCRRLMLGGQNVDADAALGMGIVDEVVSKDEVLSRAIAVARDYATIPAIAYANVKAQTRAEALRVINDTIAQKSDPTRPGWFSTETRGAMRALLEAATRKA